MNSNRRIVGPGFPLLWPVANLLAWLLGLVAGHSGLTLGMALDQAVNWLVGPAVVGVIIGASVGIVQAVLFQRYAGLAYRWVLATIAAGAVGFALGLGIRRTPVGWITNWTAPGVAIGTSFGLMQWFVLRRQVMRAWWWVWANSTAGAVGGAILSASAQFFVVGLALAVAAGTAITGLTLVRLLRSPLPQGGHARATPWPPRAIRRADAAMAGLTTLGIVAVLAILAGFQPCGWLDIPLKASGCIRILEGSSGSVESVDFSPDGRTVATAGAASGRGIVLLWRLPEGDRLALVGHTAPVSSVAFSPDGAVVASGSWDNTVRLWSSGDGALLRTLVGPKAYVEDVDFSPDGTVVGAASRDEEASIWLWRVSDGSVLYSLRNPQGTALSIDFSPDGTRLASGSTEGGVQIWRVADGALLQVLRGHRGRVQEVAFSPDGTLLASGAMGGKARLWSVTDGALIRTLHGHPLGIYSLDFSPDGTVLAAGVWDGAVLLWRVSDGMLLGTLPRHTNGGVPSVTFSPDGTMLATGSAWNENVARLWRVK